jgi:acetylglutamate kinase
MLTILKIGGNVLNKPQILSQVLDDFAALPDMKALVHGGGRAASSLAQRLGIEATMHQGRRITDEAMLEVVTYAYCGLNQQLVGALQARGCQAIGLSGADLDAIRSHKRTGWDVDYGFAGDIDAVNGARIFALLEQGLIPVFSPITHDGKGQLLNTNADTIGSAVAAEMAKFTAVSLFYLFELPGLMEDPADATTLISELDRDSFLQFQQQGIIKDGMIPKLNNAFDALQAGVKQVVLCAPEMVSRAYADDFVGTKVTLGGVDTDLH